MTDLWAQHRATNRQAVEPLAVRMRPRTLEEIVGQEHFLGPGKLLRRMLEAGRLTSIIFWGPPGTGKTTLAEAIAHDTGSPFEVAHAAMIGVKDIRRILGESRQRVEAGEHATILFLDEIHRFSRNQQDVLLGDVESGLITLIGATTENPYFAVNSALNSRSTLFRFEPLSEQQIIAVLRRAISDEERGYGALDLDVHDDALEHWARISDGDARRALNALEVAVLSHGATKPSDGESRASTPEDGQIVINRDTAEQSIQAKALVYDGTGDEHYDVISAFIKSMRGSDPDASVYWLARMLEAGEDPRFIARRIAILASEDIGNADPRAITVAASAWQITERVGMPECRHTLAQAAIYMAAAPKSNASAKAIRSAEADVREGRTLPVPIHLRDAHYPAAQTLGHGENYEYPHASADAYVSQDYLGIDRVYYLPTEHGEEAEIKRRLASLNALQTPSEPTDHTMDVNADE